MKKITILSLLITLFLVLASSSVASAHGAPSINVVPGVAVSGGQITVIGSSMEAGESFKLTLENMDNTVRLGDATATKTGDEAGFTVTYTLPASLAPGFYLVRCTAEDGDSTTTNLTILASSAQMNTQPMEANAEPLALDRSKPPLVIASVILLALISVGLGVWLVRMHR